MIFKDLYDEVGYWIFYQGFVTCGLRVRDFGSRGVVGGAMIDTGKVVDFP